MTNVTRAPRVEDSQIVANNSLILISRRVLFWIFSAIILLFLPRYLGDQGLGQLAFAQSFAALFTTVLSLGLGQFLIKEVARNRSAIKIYFPTAIGLRILTAILVAGIITGATYATGLSGDARNVMFVAAAVTITLAFVQLMDSILTGMENMGYATLAEVAGRLVVVTVGVVVLVQGLGAVAYALVLLAGTLLNLGLITAYVSRRAPLRVNLQLPRLKTLLIGGAPFILMGFVLDIYNQTDIVILRLFTSEAVVGWYAAGNQIYKAVGLLPLAFAGALLPTLSRVHSAGAEQAVAMAKKGIAIGAIVIIPLSFGMSLFSNAIIHTLPYPDAFTHTIPLLTILALTQPFTAFLMILGTIAIAVDRQKAWAIGLLVTVSLNVVLNVLAAPYFQNHYGNGGIGVALTTLVSEASMVIIGVWLMPRGVIDRAMVTTFAKVVAAGGVMVLAMLLVRVLGLGSLLTALVGVATYGAIIFTTRIVTTEELSFAWQLASRRLRVGRAAGGRPMTGSRDTAGPTQHSRREE